MAHVRTIQSETAPEYKPASKANHMALVGEEREILFKARCIIEEKFKRGLKINSPAVVSDYLSIHFADHLVESFVMLMLDNKHQIIETVTVSTGTIDGAAVYSREVIKSVLHYNAAAVVLSHNHPSGSVEPSQADLKITRQLVNALKSIEVRVLDHIIIGGMNSYSFAEHGEI